MIFWTVEIVKKLEMFNPPDEHGTTNCLQLNMIMIIENSYPIIFHPDSHLPHPLS